MKQLSYVKSLQLSRTKTTTRLYNTRNQIKTKPHRLGFFNKRKLVALAKLLLRTTRWDFKYGTFSKIYFTTEKLFVKEISIFNWRVESSKRVNVGKRVVRCSFFAFTSSWYNNRCLAAELSKESTIDKNICDVISWPWNMWIGCSHKIDCFNFFTVSINTKN